MSKFESKNLILTKKLNNVVYELMVKTNSDMVYVDDTHTLTERLSNITDFFTDFRGDFKDLKKAFDEVLHGAPETFNSFKEVWEYVNITNNPKSALIQLIESKQAAEEGKGLSTHDFSDVMYEKLKNGYSKEELDRRFEIIIDTTNKTIEALQDDLNNLSTDINKKINDINNRPNIIVSETKIQDNIISDFSCWYHIVSKDD